jgi:hypothetical protein
MGDSILLWYLVIVVAHNIWSVWCSSKMILKQCFFSDEKVWEDECWLVYLWKEPLSLIVEGTFLPEQKKTFFLKNDFGHDSILFIRNL